MWNIDLDIGAALLCLILMAFYIKRRTLPIHRNKLYLHMMVVVLLASLMDIVAGQMLNYGEYFPVQMMYGANMVYFVLIILGPVYLAFFCFSMIPAYPEQRRLPGILLQIPFLALVALILSTAKTGLFFTVDGDGGFYRGAWYDLYFVVSVFYILAGMAFVAFQRKRLRKLFRFPIYICAGMGILAYGIQNFVIPYFGVLSFGQSLGILVLFLTFQNPDFYKDSNTVLFTPGSRVVLYENDIHYKIPRRTALMAFENYEELRSTYGNAVMRKAVRRIGGWMKQSFPKSYCFYMHRGRFILVSDPRNRILIRPFDRIKEHFQTPVKADNFEMLMRPCFAHMMEDNWEHSYEEMNMAMTFAIRRSLEIGGGAVTEVDEELMERAVRDVNINKALEHAVKGEGLEVFYQPIYSTKEKKITSAEALVRIRDEELGLIFPDEFIWRAEANNSILSLGQRVFESVCAFIREHDLEELGLEYIEVNLSPVQCMRQQLAEEFKRTVERYGIDPGTINLEITESGNTVSEIIQKNMESLTDYGMTFSLDDYGTGFSNLVNVLDLPLDIVKIDKSIVWAYFKEQNKMLTHVIRIFKDSRLKIVCEGVETKEMVDTLSGMGCDYLQGYYFSKPIPSDHFVEYLRAGELVG